MRDDDNSDACDETPRAEDKCYMLYRKRGFNIKGIWRTKFWDWSKQKASPGGLVGVSTGQSLRDVIFIQRVQHEYQGQ